MKNIRCIALVLIGGASVALAADDVPTAMPNPFSGGIFAQSPSTVPPPPLPDGITLPSGIKISVPSTNTTPPPPPTAPDTSTPAPPPTPSRMFGAQLFNGSFRNLVGSGFNPNYQINIGDRIQLRMWGSFNFEGVMPVDPQGNIFLPNVGPVLVAGVRNAELNALVESQVRRVFKSNVSVYASLDVSQPVKVFVTGFVRQPGLYTGLALESALSYLDRAGGVDPDRGSYVDVAIKRGTAVLKRINLYEFLLQGKIDYVQLQDGDAIVVGPRKHTYSVSGEVYNAYDFEFEQPDISLDAAIAAAGPKAGATHVSVVRKQGSTKRSEYYPLKDAKNVTLQDGDTITVTSDRYDGTIQIRIDGAHSGEHALVLPYGAMMKDVISQIKPNSMSRMDAIQLYRVSVAKRQKEMLNLSLSKLEEAAYSARSKTSEEANLRAREADLISKFVARARNIEPKGQVVLDQKTIGTTFLEDGDTIVIPERTSVVMVHGEVLFPNAVSWRKGQSAEDYIKQVGGYTQNANTSKVVVLRPSGEALPASEVTDISAGDEIIVLPKIDSKNIEVARGITQILFQIAVTAKVVFGL